MAPVYALGFLKAQVDIESARFQAALAHYGQTALNAFSELNRDYPTKPCCMNARPI